ncbi:hypothetical protein [Enterococcus rotai]
MLNIIFKTGILNVSVPANNRPIVINSSMKRMPSLSCLIIGITSFPRES